VPGSRASDARRALSPAPSASAVVSGIYIRVSRAPSVGELIHIHARVQPIAIDRHSARTRTSGPSRLPRWASALSLHPRPRRYSCTRTRTARPRALSAASSAFSTAFGDTLVRGTMFYTRLSTASRSCALSRRGLGSSSLDAGATLAVHVPPRVGGVPHRRGLCKACAAPVSTYKRPVHAVVVPRGCGHAGPAGRARRGHVAPSQRRGLSPVSLHVCQIIHPLSTGDTRWVLRCACAATPIYPCGRKGPDMRRSLRSVAVDANNEITSSPVIKVEQYNAALTAHILERIDGSTVIHNAPSMTGSPPMTTMPNGRGE
jgi:hypothetical protein